MDSININEASSKELLGYFQAKLDEEAWEAKKAGKPVCWSASVAPPEFCVAMDIALVYPETHAAGAGARKASMDLLEVADKKGYNIDICSYARTNLGYMELLKQEAMNGEKPELLKTTKAAYVPLPDIVITCNNICNTLLKWYENIAKELNIPCIIIDVPFNHSMPVARHCKEYIADQFRVAIKQLEEFTGRAFDYDKFTIHPEIEGPLGVYEITMGKGGELKFNAMKDELQNILALELGIPAVELIRCGGGDLLAAQREQWNDGSNTLCIAPGTVVTYERNYVSNELLDKKGVKVLSIPSAELSRGRGGPRCMSCPVNRVDL